MDAIVSLVVSLLLVVTGAGGSRYANLADAAAETPARTMAPMEYWQAVLPETPMPRAIHDLLKKQSTVHASQDYKRMDKEEKYQGEENLREVSISYGSRGDDSSRKVRTAYGSQSGEDIWKNSKTYGFKSEDKLKEVSISYGSQGGEDLIKDIYEIYGSNSEGKLREVSVSYGSQGEDSPRKVSMPYGSQSREDLRETPKIDGSKGEQNLREVSISYGSQQAEEGSRKVPMSYGLQSGHDLIRKIYKTYGTKDEEKLREVSISYGSQGEDYSRMITLSYGLPSGEDLMESSEIYGSNGEDKLREVSVSYGSQGEDGSRKVTMYGLQRGENLRKTSNSYGSKGEEKLREVSISYGSQIADGSRKVPVQNGPPNGEDLRKSFKTYNSKADEKLKEVSISYGSQGGEELRKSTNTVGSKDEKLKEVSVSYGSKGDRHHHVHSHHDEKLKEVSVSYGSQGDMHYHHVHSHHDADKIASVFFFHDVLRPRSVITPTIPPTTSLPPLLPRRDADSLPFSTERLADILAMFAPASLAMADEIRWTLDTCEHPRPLPGEKAGCATSLESLARLPAALLGTRDVRAFSAGMPSDPAGAPAQRGRHNITAVRKLSRSPSATAVTCHDLTYPYAVFYCHTANSTAAYLVTLVPEEDSGAPAMEALVMCHLDTSLWNPSNPFFLKHNLKPGDVAVCHFLSKLSMIWVPADEQGGAHEAQ